MKLPLSILALTFALSGFAGTTQDEAITGIVNVHKMVGTSSHKVCSAKVVAANTHFNSSGSTLVVYGYDSTIKKNCRCDAVLHASTSQTEIVEALTTKGFSLHCTSTNVGESSVSVVAYANASQTGHDIVIGK